MNGSACKKAMARARARRGALGTKRAAGSAEGASPAELCRRPAEEAACAAAAAPAPSREEAPVECAVVAAAQATKRSAPVLMLVVDEEEPVEFCTEEVQSAVCASIETPDTEPPFDPPDLDELLHAGACDDEEEPPFDPIEVEELLPPSLSEPIVCPEAEPPAPANENGRGAQLGPVRNPEPEGAREQPAPAIRIHFSWDRSEAAELFRAATADPRLARAETTILRGGLDGAAVHCAGHEPAHLIVIDTNLRGPAMLSALDRLMANARDAKIIVLGALNDVSLLRELSARGVDEYLVWPVDAGEIAGAACALFAETDKARVIAVVGARGGIGASTVAHNLAWCIAERQCARTTLIDLDLPWGTAALQFRVGAARSLGDVLDAADPLNDAALERVSVRRTERLTIVSAPPAASRTADLDAELAQTLIGAARRLSTFVVLDLPHLWAPWVKQALLGADEVVLVSCPDLAALRNTDNIAKWLKNERNSDPLVVLSMAGVPKRPEVPLKEFAEALGIVPACTFAFEPNIHGAASITGRLLAEVAPEAKTVGLFDRVATLLTGREPVQLLRADPRAPAPPQATVSQIGPMPEIPVEPPDPFEHALVNPYALLPEDALNLLARGAAEESRPTELPTLHLLEPVVVEPDYIVRARAAALDELHAIETSGRPHRRGMLGRLAGGAAVFSILLVAAAVYVDAKSEAAAPARALRVSVEIIEPPASPPLSQQIGEYRAALLDLEAGRSDEAHARLQQLADSGLVMAQHRLAKLYERGEGLAPDLTEARRWAERAAAGGNRNAMHDLGVYYARGEGVRRDEAAAARWFERAAKLGLADSQYNLGVLYEHGRGVEAAAGEAWFWFMLAAEQGDSAAAERALALELQISASELEQARARLAEFRPGAADPVANGDFAAAGAE